MEQSQQQIGNRTILTLIASDINGEMLITDAAVITIPMHRDIDFKDDTFTFLRVSPASACASVPRLIAVLTLSSRLVSFPGLTPVSIWCSTLPLVAISLIILLVKFLIVVF
uniref:Uncharacterized protein n=1 Tax=Cacopsylla melanoneura TaxID=428564 RepID=A0A8D8X7G1_9HEMI